MAHDALAPADPLDTPRSRAKADRRRQLLRAAAKLIAAHGFPGVRLEDLGAAVGITGPAVYRHFPNKEALLIELLLDISRRLLAGASAVVERTDDPRHALEQLVDFHLDFALGDADLIRVQDRNLQALPESARHEVRLTQRRYVDMWIAVLRRIDLALDKAEARAMAHAVFGLINSTPHSADPASPAATRATLRRMALAALRARATKPRRARGARRA